ncbi:tRNA lysidine(34) synthetase TilS [Oceanicola granulosus]
MGSLLGPHFPERVGLAVSGGGDSMAMLHLAAAWARVFGIRLAVVTVDHGLRPEAADEAALVAAEAELLGLPHDVLRWHWDGQGNLQDAARRARARLIGDWRGEIAHVAFAHTRDDQAETLLLRLRRGSGVEGLSGMAERRDMGGWQIVRPLLDAGRDELRHYCRVLRIPYADDPSNADPTYDRVRIRRLLSDLEAEGLGAGTLAATAARLRRARTALARRAYDVAERVASTEAGDVLFERDGFAGIETDTQLRLLAAALQYVASAEYRPRAAALEALLERALAGGGGTLHGCRVLVGRTHTRIAREYEAVRALRDEAGVWDRRWRVVYEPREGLAVRALGEVGLAQAPELPDAPRVALHAAPALFDGDRLVACPRLGHGTGLSVQLSAPGGVFPDRLLSD